MFWENFVRECARIQKSPAVVVEELGFSNSMPTSWKKGTLPHIKNRKKIADYFGITVDELMGIQKEPAGQGGLGYEWPEVEEAFKNASPEARARQRLRRWLCWRVGRSKRHFDSKIKLI